MYNPHTILRVVVGEVRFADRLAQPNRCIRLLLQTATADPMISAPCRQLSRYDRGLHERTVGHPPCCPASGASPVDAVVFGDRAYAQTSVACEQPQWSPSLGNREQTLRIIAGKYRGRNLKSPPSMHVRPTSDRLRETLFNVIAPRIEGTRFLDLCSGSGAIGIEALSRGAAYVTFVDRSRRMCGLVETNLDLVQIPEDHTEVVQSEAEEFLRRVCRGKTGQQGHEGPWDLVYFDPPYATDYLGVLSLLGEQAESLLREDGRVIVEHHHKNALPDDIGSIRRQRILKQGDSALSFYVRATSVIES